MSFYGDDRRGRRDKPRGAGKKACAPGVHMENPADRDSAASLIGEGSLFPSLSNVGSLSECTGLTPSPPPDEDAMDAYKDLSPMEIPDSRK